MATSEQYVMRMKDKGVYYYFHSFEENPNTLTVEWVRFPANAQKFNSQEEIKALKEKHPVIKGNVVIYRKLK